MRGPPPGDAVRLLDERDREAERARGVGGGHEVTRGDAAARAVAQNEDAARICNRVEMDARGTVRRGHVDRHRAS